MSRILLGVSGGIAAYKCLELIRRLRERDQFDIVIINDDAERATRELQQRLDALLDADSVKGSE